MVALHPVLHHDDVEDAVGHGHGHGDGHDHDHGIVHFVRPRASNDVQMVALGCNLLLSS